MVPNESFKNTLTVIVIEISVFTITHSATVIVKDLVTLQTLVDLLFSMLR